MDALDRYGFEWDGAVIFQSGRHEHHVKALQALIERHLAYPCGCSRKDLANAARGPLGAIYPGTCRDGGDMGETAIRLRTTNAPIAFADGLQGLQTQCLEKDSGDFVIRRRDGLIAYHLAVVVDDAIDGITEIVRGIDLMDSTPRQIWLQQLLGYRTPDYFHIPVVTYPNGDKLSKFTGAKAVPMQDVSQVLCAALIALRQNPPPELLRCGLAEIWQWAMENWQIEAMQDQRAVSTDSSGLAAIWPGVW